MNPMKNKNQIQQGDVLLRIVPVLPAGCKRLTHRTIAVGEATGHHHTFDEGVALMEAPDKTVFAVNESDEPRTLIHQEHGATVLQPGQVAESGQVREKDWFADMVRNVRD